MFRRLYVRFVWWLINAIDIPLMIEWVPYSISKLLYPYWLWHAAQNEWYRQGCDECSIKPCSWPKGICKRLETL